VILATNMAAPLSLKAVGWLVSDGATTAQATSNSLEMDRIATLTKGEGILTASQNPFSSSTTASFTLPSGGDYTLALYNEFGKKLRVLKQGTAHPGDLITAEVDGSHLYRGLYFVRLQTAAASSKTLRLLFLK
jgi:hypothetical protein